MNHYGEPDVGNPLVRFDEDWGGDRFAILPPVTLLVREWIIVCTTKTTKGKRSKELESSMNLSTYGVSMQ